MDPSVLRGMARWPDVPAVYGWLALDRRGSWLLKETAGGGFGRIGNAALREFIARNYEADGRGRWFFQNGPQRVYVALAYTPPVFHYRGAALYDHCGRPAQVRATYSDEEGSILMLGERGVGLLDDRDLLHFAERLAAGGEAPPAVARSEVAVRFGYVAQPAAGPSVVVSLKGPGIDR